MRIKNLFLNRVMLTLFILTSISSADLRNVVVTESFLKKNIKIIDIRTKNEWKETGMIRGSYPITFFNENGNYDIKEFLRKLNTVVNKNEEFAIICRTGSRTRIVGNFLGNKAGYKVINLQGGIMNLFRSGYISVDYPR